jgi:hypothetical protein
MQHLIDLKLKEIIDTLKEDVFNFRTIDDEEKDRIFLIFKDSYEKSLGTSWSKDKFLSRARNWEFYGTEKGFVAVRPQKSGLYKLVGVAGNTRDVIKGLNELESKNVPVWGMVSSDIKSMAEKKGFKTPSKIMLKMLYKLIPKEVFGGVDTEINKDGSITLKYSDVGHSKKYFIGNKKYFDKIKKDVMPSLRSKIKLSEDITAGSAIVYHRTGAEQVAKGIAADGYRVGRGAWYGVGVYTTYSLDSLLNYRMESLYGNVIIESKVLDMKDFLIFDYDIAKKIYKSNYTLDKQLKKILGNEWNKYKNNEDIIKTIEKIGDEPSGWAAKYLYDNYESIFDNCRGIVFTGTQDGEVLVSYDRGNIEPIRYSIDNGKSWVNVLNKNIYDRIKTRNAFKKYLDTDTKDIHLKNKIDVGKTLSKDDFDNLSVEQKDKYLNNKINTISLVSGENMKSSYNIYDQYFTEYEFKEATDEQKKKYISAKVDNNHQLFPYEFAKATYQQKKKHIDIILNSRSLTELEFEFANYKQRLKHLKIKIFNKKSFEDYELEKFTDDEIEKVKLELDLDGKVNSLNLSREDFRLASKKQKIRYIALVIHSGYIDLKDYELDAATKEQKKQYIDSILYKGNRLEDYEFEAATENQKEKYIDAKLKNEYRLNGYEFKAATDKQKAEYISMKIYKERTPFLFKYEFEAATENQKLEYILKNISRGERFEHYEFEGLSNESKKILVSKMLEQSYQPPIYIEQWAKKHTNIDFN